MLTILIIIAQLLDQGEGKIVINGTLSYTLKLHRTMILTDNQHLERKAQNKRNIQQ